jgi:bile acid-coenzyme A ligase
VIGEHTKPISYGSRLSQLAAERGDETGLIFASQDDAVRDFTFLELEEAANRAANLLATHEVDNDSVVVISLRNCAEHVWLTFATWKLGACVLPINPRLPEWERAQIFEAAAESGRPLFVVSEGALPDGFAGFHVDRLRRLGEYSAEAPPDIVPCPGKAIGSGGSTGRSKIIVDPKPWAGVPLAPGVIDNFGRRAGQVVLISGPLYHNGPFTAYISLFDGCPVVLMERFNAERAVELIERHGVNWTFMVPTQMQRIARLPGVERRDFSSLEGLYHSGAPCPPWLKRWWLRVLGPERVFEAYGATESIGGIYIRGDEWLEHPGSVGRARLADVRILGPNGEELAAGEVGEIFLRWKKEMQIGSRQLSPVPEDMYRYWGSEPLKTMPDGFSAPGDLGWLDEDGYLFLADRRLDLIITGGVNVYAAEVEAALSEHPAVADVAVVGLPDPEWGRRVHAIVQVAAGVTVSEADLDAHCRARLNPHKLPKTYEFVEVLPRTESGKIRRSQLVADRALKASA